MVLREVQMGYAWRHGLLRRAKVVVSGPAGAASGESDEDGQAAEAMA